MNRKYKNISLLTLLFFLITCHLQARTITPKFGEIKFEQLTMENGLSSNSCFCTFQDQDGYIWFGTEDGLNRWDGNEFKVFRNNPDDSTSISNNKVMWITEDVIGILWVSTLYGLNRYNKITERFTRYFFDDEKINVSHANTVGPIVEDGRDFFWIGTHLGLIHFNKKDGSFKRFIPDPNNLDFSLIGHNTISWITKGQKNELLIRSVGGLLTFDIATGKFDKIYLPNNYQPNPRLMPIAYTFVLYEDDVNNLWLQLNDGRLYKYNIQTRKLTYFKEFYEITGLTINDQIFAIETDQEGFLWVGTLGKGLYCINWEKGSFINYLPDKKNTNSISSNWIYNIYVDKEGILWALSFNRGINKITIPKSKTIVYEYDPSNENGLQNGDIMDLCEDDEGMLWIASLTQGVSKLNPQTREFIYIPFMTKSSDGTTDRRISSLLKDRSGKIWIGSLGLDMYNPEKKSFTHFKYNPQDSTSISNSWVISMFEGNDGYLWYGLKGNGLERYDRKTNIFKHYSYSSQSSNSLSNNYVNCINQDDNNALWVGTENGLCKLVNNKFRRFKHQTGNPKSISGNFIYIIFKDSKNRLWIGTEEGLNLLNKENDTFLAFEEVGILNRNKIFSILEDDHSNLWLRTNLGLIRFNPGTKKYRLFNEKDNLKHCRSIAYGFRAFLKAKSGEIYYGGSQSLVVFHPNSLEINREPPDVVLTKLRINYKSVEIGDNSPLKKAINLNEQIVLNYNQNILTLQYTALNYLEQEIIQYAYRMQGVNDDWVYCGNQRIASYTNLDPGHYTFLVKASYNNEDWSEHPKSLIITITSPWWATWWFRTIMFLLLIGFVYSIYRYRINKVLEIERLRVQIASDLHDDIGSALTRIAVHSEIIQTTTEKEKVSSASKRIGNMSREIITILSDVVWSIDSRNDTVGDLIDRMRDFIDTIFPAGSIHIDFQTKGLHFDQKVEQALRQNIYLIFKEAVNNAAKHSCADEIKISMINGDGKFKMEIADNGTGINEEYKQKGHHGIENMELRAKRINGELKIENLEKGTSVTLIAKNI